MAKKHVLHMIDDLDGTEAHQTVRFGLDGKHYEIDLKDEHAQQLRDSLGRFVGFARVVTPAKGAGRPVARGTASRAAAASKEHLARVREWAKSQGHHVADRGRIPTNIVAEYEAAHRH
jgi:hypothetical protein